MENKFLSYQQINYNREKFLKLKLEKSKLLSALHRGQTHYHDPEDGGAPTPIGARIDVLNDLMGTLQEQGKY